VFEHRGRQAQLLLGLAARGDVGIDPDAALVSALRIERATGSPVNPIALL
jgi:hypothetical protein